ncbi:putative ras guanyl-nucleotide exchange factor RasGEF [Sphaerosporella brunnea]|uniref:Putative ras guanyl-nucleotide exchange factor RasGEF n=1 Tax=Sphaerosporella brunnea TaxID=1250544 RepID=A0A5J5EG57_9PEZI|nr:putative ras guanyl-nucleotide exchange factor RasGEF [Sphaerosporella brunnea]
MSRTTAQIRAMYRQLLRELPPISIRRTKAHSQARERFVNADAIPQQHAQQLLRFLRAQRVYTTLLERYNPGLAGELDVAEHTRLTARRVGLDMPKEMAAGEKN